MKTNSLKQILGKAAYKSLIELEKRALRSKDPLFYTFREEAIVYGRKATRFDTVDFIHNHYSPYLPR